MSYYILLAKNSENNNNSNKKSNKTITQEGIMVMQKIEKIK